MSPAIYLELERMGFKVWYDNRAADLTKEGMLKGIEQAAAFVLFLSQGERGPHTAPPTGQVHTIADANPSFCALPTRPQRGPPAPVLPDGDPACSGAQEALGAAPR